jgi:hypothetical protein
MTKIVINNCYGGFGLSEEAQLILYSMKSRIIKSDTPKQYYGGNNKDYLLSRDWKKAYEDDLKSPVGLRPVVAPDGRILYVDHYGDKYRTDKKLINVVEEMGEMVNGRFSNLKIVGIPDGVKWQIDDYDGMETIHEKHRVWS